VWREQPLEPRVPAFRHARRDFDAVMLFGIEIDVEVLGLQHLEVQLLVLDLVAARSTAPTPAQRGRR